jgi:protein gp37
MGSKIDWTDEGWPVATGCEKVSPGCDRCYAASIAHRFNGTKAWPNGFDVTLWPSRLHVPMHWRRPRLVFVCHTGDLFHHRVPDEFIARVFAVMQSCKTHTFQLLTKRHARMRTLLSSDEFWFLVEAFGQELSSSGPARDQYPVDFGRAHRGLPNVLLGVSAENQQFANIRIPALMRTPGFLRWVSAEPLLGAVDLSPYLRGTNALDWVVVGGESGPDARPMQLAWARDLAAQCEQAGAAYFFKQTGSALAKELGHRGKGNHPEQWPESFPRQYPQRAA